MYSVPIEYLLIVVCSKMLIWTCVERKESAPIDYGHVEQIFKAKNVGKSVSLQQSKHIMLYDLYQA